MEIQRKNGVILIDDSDYYKIRENKFRFEVNKKKCLYKKRDNINPYFEVIISRDVNKIRQRVILARYILEVKEKDVLADHINHNSLDNRRCNLRLVNKSQNQLNCKKNNADRRSSMFKGVCFNTANNNWLSSIGIKGRLFNIKKYDYEELAALAYDFFAKSLYKEHCHANFPDDMYDDYIGSLNGSEFMIGLNERLRIAKERISFNDNARVKKTIT